MSDSPPTLSSLVPSECENVGARLVPRARLVLCSFIRFKTQLESQLEIQLETQTKSSHSSKLELFKMGQLVQTLLATLLTLYVRSSSSQSESKQGHLDQSKEGSVAWLKRRCRKWQLFNMREVPRGPSKLRNEGSQRQQPSQQENSGSPAERRWHFGEKKNNEGERDS